MLRSRGVEAAEDGELGLDGTATTAGVTGLLATLRTCEGSIEFPAGARPLVIGWSDPFGKRKHAVSGAGSEGAARTLAPRNNEQGTIRIGFVGRARHGCGGGESPGLELVGGDAFAGTGVGGSLTTCRVLQ